MSSFKTLGCTDSLMQGVQSSALLFDQEGMYSIMLFNFVDMYKKCRNTTNLAKFWKDKMSLKLPAPGPGEQPDISVLKMFPELLAFNTVLWKAVITGDYTSFRTVSSNAETLAAKYCRSAVNHNIVGIYEFFDGAFDLGRRMSDMIICVENLASYTISAGSQLDPNGPYFKSVFGPGGRISGATKRCSKAMTDLMNAILGKDGGFSFDEILKSGGIDVMVNFLQNNLGSSISGVVFCNIIYPLIGLSREIGGIGGEVASVVQGLVGQLKMVINMLVGLVGEMQKIIEKGVTMATAVGAMLGFIAFSPLLESLMEALISSTKGLISPTTLRTVSLVLRDMDCSRRQNVLAGVFSKAGLSDGKVNSTLISLSEEIDLVRDAIYGNLSSENYKAVNDKYVAKFGDLQKAYNYLAEKRTSLKDFSDRHYREGQMDGKFDISKISTPGCDEATLRADTEFMESYPEFAQAL
jgi:hypothetical protein